LIFASSQRNIYNARAKRTPNSYSNRPAYISSSPYKSRYNSKSKYKDTSGSKIKGSIENDLLKRPFKYTKYSIEKSENNSPKSVRSNDDFYTDRSNQDYNSVQDYMSKDRNVPNQISSMLQDIDYWSRKEFKALRSQNHSAQIQARRQARLAKDTKLVMWMCAANGMAMLCLAAILLALLIRQRKKMDKKKYKNETKAKNLPTFEDDISDSDLEQ
ncbi:MAG: hypothetical protein MHPSP_000734, partial [Paramarteilia canceri]